MIVLIANTKGGTGKSTLAVNLAVQRSRGRVGNQPRRVLAIDGDKQETTLNALSQRRIDLMEPAVNVAGLTTPQAMHTQAAPLGADYDDVIIDVGGRDNPTFRAAMLIADRIVVPFAPSVLDLWEVGNMTNLLDEARALNPDLQAAAVLNKVPPAGTTTDEAAEVLGQYAEDFAVLACRLGQRVAFGRAAAQGLAVTELNPFDPKAAEEIVAFTEAVFGAWA